MMRLGIIIAIASAVVVAGCSSSRAVSKPVARGYAPLDVMSSKDAPVRVVRTQTVTARPVARRIERDTLTAGWTPPPAPEIPEASTRASGTLRPARRTFGGAEINPASRPARTPASITTATKPIAPVAAPAIEEACPGGVCAVPDPCDPCPGGNCGIPDPVDTACGGFDLGK